MPELLKIGFTNRPVEQRVNELNAATGVPSPFVVEAWFAATDSSAAERLVHDRLDAFRVEGKEFFELDLATALNALEAVLECGPSYCRHDPRPFYDVADPVSCPHCGAKNRIRPLRIRQSARCGKCGETLIALRPWRPVWLGGG
jgi:T5orf172 domain.